MTLDGPVQVDDAQAEALLVARFGPEVSAVERVGHGEWSRAYAFSGAGIDYVIRFSALREDFEKDRRAARYASQDLPIPPIIDIGEAYGGWFAIAERQPGEYLDALDGSRMRAALPSLFACLDAARRVDLSASTGYGPWNVDGDAPHPSWRAALLDVANGPVPRGRTHGWRERLAASPTGPRPFEAAYQHLQRLAGYGPEERHLIHSDLLNDNVLVSGDRVSALLDWGNSMYGDFLYDVAWFCFWSPWYGEWREIDFRREAARHYESIGLDVPYFEERLRCYQVHIGLDGQAYNAFRERWSELDAIAERTLEIATGNA